MLALLTVAVLMVPRSLMEPVYDVHHRAFGVSPHEFRVILYCWVGLLKLLVIVLILIPWATITMVMRNAK